MNDVYAALISESNLKHVLALTVNMCLESGLLAGSSVSFEQLEEERLFELTVS